MFAFWDDIKVRRGLLPGSARPFPSKHALPPWATQLTKPMETVETDDKQYQTTDPIELDRVYETLDGKAWSNKQMGMPSYDQVYQGF